MKECSKCHKIKPINDFHLNCKSKDKHNSQCKICSLETGKIWAMGNREKCRKASRRWINTHKEEHKNRNREWAKANQTKVLERVKTWRKLNPEKVKAIESRWRKANPEKMKALNRRRTIRKFSTPQGRLNHNLSAFIWQSLKGNKRGRKWETLVGYTLEELKLHLEFQFKDGMSWENYGRNGWWIDYIIPRGVFNFEKPEDDDFKRCWSLGNLQPLWAEDNIKKSDKLDKHFQPRLVFN